MGLSNLPPGVTDSMIPGNRPEDFNWDQWCEYLSGALRAAQIDCNGDQFDVLATELFNHFS